MAGEAAVDEGRHLGDDAVGIGGGRGEPVVEQRHRAHHRDDGADVRRRAADGGAARASFALYRQGEALTASAARVKKASYDTQRYAWAKTFVPEPRARLTRVKQISSAGYRPMTGDQARLYSAVAEGGRRNGAASPVINRGLAVAALNILGEDGRARNLMSEPRSGMCVRVAKLNLYQCLSAAGPYYEDIYCLAQHGMAEPASCATAAVKPLRTAQR